METSDLNPNNVGQVGTQSFLASMTTIVDGVNEVGTINLLSLNDGSLKTETINNVKDQEINTVSKAKFSVPNDQLIVDAIQQLEIENNVLPTTYQIKDTIYFEVPNTIKKEYIIKGKLIDFYTLTPISGANIILPLPGTKFNTKTNVNGEFTINAIYPINKDTEKTTIRPPILVTAKGYIPKKLTPYALDQTIREDLSTTQLKSLQGLTDDAKNKIIEYEKGLIKLINRLKPTKAGLKKLMKKFIKIIKERLLPYILALLAPYLIGKLTDILIGKLGLNEAQAPCPSPEQVAIDREKRNKIVNQLNQIYSVVNTALTVVGILGGLATVIKIAAGVIRAIPLPTSVPPGVGFPTSIILKFQQLITKLEVIAEKVFTRSLGVSSVLLVLSALLLNVLKILKILDAQLERCSNDNEIALEAIAFEAAVIDEESGPIDNLVNGFKMGISTDVKNQVGSLPRRFATATNAQGVVILKGEPSFSASEQILINELAFYIRSNNLKAN